jgi:hypothetical protein
MKLSLSVLKNVLICGDEGDEIDMWIKDNIGDGEVSVREWLDEFNKYWKEWSDDFGDSVEIKEILKKDYKLSESEVDEIMMIYWGCDNMGEYIKGYK